MDGKRWMGSKISGYAIKMWLFCDQFKLTKSEVRGIRDLATFAVMIHLQAWITAPLAIEAQLNDFQLMRKLLTYP